MKAALLGSFTFLFISAFSIFLISAACSDSSNNQRSLSESSATSTATPPNPESKKHVVQILPNSYIYDQDPTNDYDPAIIYVDIGEKVFWINLDREAHSIREYPDGIRSIDLYPGDIWEYEFTESGTYKYYCDLHPWIWGKVIVREK